MSITEIKPKNKLVNGTITVFAPGHGCGKIHKLKENLAFIGETFEDALKFAQESSYITKADKSLLLWQIEFRDSLVESLSRFNKDLTHAIKVLRNSGYEVSGYVTLKDIDRSNEQLLMNDRIEENMCKELYFYKTK